MDKGTKNLRECPHWEKCNIPCCPLVGGMALPDDPVCPLKGHKMPPDKRKSKRQVSTQLKKLFYSL